MRKITIGIMIFFCAMLASCGTKDLNQEVEEETENSIMDVTQTEFGTTQEDGNTGEASGKQTASGKLVSTVEFIEYYQMQENDVPSDYLAAFIQHRQLTMDSLGERAYDAMVKKLYERGVTFGSTITDLISGKVVQLSQEDDFTDVAYIVINKDIYMDGTDMSAPQNIVLEVDNRKIYITQKNVTDDYTTEENVRDISEQDIKECLQKLRSMITADWNSGHEVEGKTYGWRLHIVKHDGSVISYQGEGIDEVFHPGLEQWFQTFFE